MGVVTVSSSASTDSIGVECKFLIFPISIEKTIKRRASKKSSERVKALSTDEASLCTLEVDYNEAAAKLENIYKLSPVTDPSGVEDIIRVVRRGRRRRGRTGELEDKEENENCLDWKKMKIPAVLPSSEHTLTIQVDAAYEGETCSKVWGQSRTEGELAEATSMTVVQVRKHLEVGQAARNKLIKVRVEIQRAKLELLFELQRLPTEKEITKKVGISPKRYHDVMRADIDGVGGDKRRQPALLRLALDDVLDSLKPKESLVIRQRYGLDGRGDRTLGEIAGNLNISREMVRKHEVKALMKLRHPVRVDLSSPLCFLE
ncbi:sigma factor E [Actinidia rufa]|uniref:Sigma factor E n=1 Tax=Actinidia rufa TaxID=165716 RepID=A0A7J0ECN9_9ERIC|nr:sigma factor E [Actinidia rufa]